MISSVRALPYACLSPLLNELQRDSAVDIAEFQFDENYSFSDLVRRDLVPWIRSWPADVRAKLQLSLAHEWKFCRGQLRAKIENSDMNVLIGGDHLTVWRELYRDLFDADIGADSETIAGDANLGDLTFEPGSPEPLWLLTEQQRRHVEWKKATVAVELDGEVVGEVFKHVLRDVRGVGDGPLGAPRTYAGCEVEALHELLNELLAGAHTLSPELSSEQISTLRFVRAAARRATEQGLELRILAS